MRRLHDEMHITSVFVTHDQEEAMEVADRIVVMNQGRIEQVGTPDQVYDHPASPFVLQFLGDVNLFHGRDHAPGAVAAQAGADAQAVSYVRPHEIQVMARAEEGSLAVSLVHALTVGPNTRLEFKRSDGQGEVDVELPRAEYAALRDSGVLQNDSTVYLKPRRIRRFKVVGGGARPEFVETDPASLI
jgi:sulfate transport system ATP-binding protein